MPARSMHILNKNYDRISLPFPYSESLRSLLHCMQLVHLVELAGLGHRDQILRHSHTYRKLPEEFGDNPHDSLEMIHYRNKTEKLALRG